MQYSPKLKRVMAEIKAIMEREDLTGIVILHEPEFSEFLLKVDTAESCARIDQYGQLHITTKHFLTRERKKKAVEHTANMFVHLTDVGKAVVGSCMQALSYMEQKFEIRRTGGGFTSNAQQNN